MIYAVNSEGVEKIKETAGKLFSANQTMLEIADKMSRAIASAENSLGPHYNSIEDVIQHIRDLVNSSGDSVLELSSALIDLAQNYQDIIDYNLFADIDGTGEDGGHEPRQKVKKT